MGKTKMKCIHCKKNKTKLTKITEYHKDINDKRNIWVCDNCIWEIY